MIESWATKKILQAFENKDVGSIHSLVVQQCINPNALIPSKGVSLLHLIIGHQSEGFALKITKLFLRCGGDPNVQSADGVTPTHVAAAWGRTRLLHLLLVNGGDPWVQDDEKKNAFNYAFEEREWTSVEMLHHFHQMHSAAKWRQDAEPKYDRSLERVLLRKGEEMFAYAPSRICMKSMTTQTQSEHRGQSPVQDKIKYFEPASGVDLQRGGKGEMGWVKDFYQTSCEVVVHEDASEKAEESKKFISSIEIDPSPLEIEPVPEKSEQSSMDVRGQLFVELQEAVRRRSKQKTAQEMTEKAVVIEDDPSKDSFVAKEVSYLYGVNLQENEMLKNMSDFATKVMKEIEVTEGDRLSEKTIDLCASSTDFTTTYLSCEEATSKNKSYLQTPTVAQNESNASSSYLTPYNSEIVRGPVEENSNDSFVSLAEEYKYTDAEEGVVLLEKKLVVTPTISFCQDEGLSNGEEEASTVSSNASSVPCSLNYSSDVLRSELHGLGYNPGPVTQTTKKLYLRKLWKLKKERKTEQKERTEGEPPQKKRTLAHSPILERTLADDEYFHKILSFGRLEEEMTHSFEKWTSRKWRQGSHKTSFNYLLLDPRLSLNFPKRAASIPVRTAWKDFLSAIFYVGKGKRGRPYAHLYQAAAVWEKRTELPRDGKTERILEIWKSGLGVVCLQIFQNIMPVEALTREAAMIEALGVGSLENARAGEYYGGASTWPSKDKAKLGVYLLHKAMLIFINEGDWRRFEVAQLQSNSLIGVLRTSSVVFGEVDKYSRRVFCCVRSWKFDVPFASSSQWKRLQKVNQRQKVRQKKQFDEYKLPNGLLVTEC